MGLFLCTKKNRTANMKIYICKKVKKRNYKILFLQKYVFAQIQESVAELLEVHASTANRLINDLVQLGILEELTGFKRNRIFTFQAYIDLFNTP